ncbi:hypothetical protein [Microcella humidisoli]|uniref:Uncharacterized protein n=1 Tax=Microcella humidisoli TaxID=2963406 RepID=A0ABY5FWV5_9MICO|nr:hypothetical protein [Microcella humidisoli]UTT62614.1 hypothetical protein NNL39_00380 [Microcella humidisoli]
MTTNDAPRETLTRTEKFTLGLFSIFAALIILPGIVFSAISIFSTGSIDLGPKP